MTTDESPPAERFSLSRWSRRKHEVARAERSSPQAAGTPAASPVAEVAPPVAVAPSVATNAPAAAPLPPVDSLTFDSDFAPFVQPKVDESTKRAALKKLFADPRFNAMDGLDVYVDDYTQADPMPVGMLDKLARVYDTIVDEKSPAAAAQGEAAPATAVAATPAQVAPVADEAVTSPAQLSDERKTSAAPLTPTLSPQAGSGRPEETSS